MARRHRFSHWLLFSWLVLTVAEGQKEIVTPPGGSQNNIDPTDCEIFTLTPPPTTRNPVTRVQTITRTRKCPFHFLPWRRPRIHLRFPNRHFFPPKCNHRFQFWPFYWPHSRLTARKYFPRRIFQKGSSSEESREKREAQTHRSKRSQYLRKGNEKIPVFSF
ncbi:odontogenesis associated phosphoprotein [Cynocephalus volans]|uniref:odontogenesis associated phosphoprotein n=1 Tax=Cynocephalus volans TaxID=110931 RepID=UPI002FC58529